LIIKMTDKKDLLITVLTTIFCGENNADLITFMIPAVYEGQDMAECSVEMSYIRPDGVGADERLQASADLYKGYLQYGTMVDTHLAAASGIAVLWLTFTDKDDNVILKTNEVNIHILTADGAPDSSRGPLYTQADWAQEDVMAPDYIRNKEKLYEQLGATHGVNAVQYTKQTLSTDEQEQARANINAAPQLMLVQVLPSGRATYTATEVYDHCFNKKGLAVLVTAIDGNSFALYPMAMTDDGAIIFTADTGELGTATAYLTADGAVETGMLQNGAYSGVESVNDQTGVVVLTASDVGAVSIDELNYTVNEAIASAVADGTFTGPQGEPGVSGVYVGSGEMPEDCNVQIDPEGEVFTMDDFVAEALAALPVWDGGAY